MDLIVREYRKDDKAFLGKCMNGMQEHIASIDILHRSKHIPDFNGEKWVENIFKKINKNGGAVFIAEFAGEKVGCIAGIIKKSTDEDSLDTLPFKDGRIIELFVDPLHRGEKIGSRLVKSVEQYFRKNGCGVAELGVLQTNTAAHELYKKHGYTDRYIDMCKKL